MVRILIYTAAAVTVLAGCSGLPSAAYKSPVGSRTATVHFALMSDAVNMRVFRLKGDMVGCACSSEQPETIGIFHNRGILTADHSDYADKGNNVSEFQVEVAADEPFRFMLQQYDTAIDSVSFPRTIIHTYCEVHRSIVPHLGETYYVTFTDRTGRDCNAATVELQHGSTRVPVEAAQYPMCALYPGKKQFFSEAILSHCQVHPTSN